MASSKKIFGVGLNKTGTVSLNRAVEILGFSSIHFVRPSLSADIQRAILDGEPMFRDCPRTIKRADAYFDITAVRHYFDVADREYPGSRFILHTRDLDAWLDSRQRHLLRNHKRAAEGAYRGQWLEDVDLAAWTETWQKHHERVRSYFAERPGDLLEIDIAAGDGWEKLAPFLGRPVPAETFPFLNRDGYRAMPRRTMAQRAKNRLKGPARRVGLI